MSYIAIEEDGKREIVQNLNKENKQFLIVPETSLTCRSNQMETVVSSDKPHYRVADMRINSTSPRLKKRPIRQGSIRMEEPNALSPGIRIMSIHDHSDHSPLGSSMFSRARKWKKIAAVRARRRQISSYYKREREYNFIMKSRLRSGLLQQGAPWQQRQIGLGSGGLHQSTDGKSQVKSKKVHWNPLVYHIDSGVKSNLVDKPISGCSSSPNISSGCDDSGTVMYHCDDSDDDSSSSCYCNSSSDESTSGVDDTDDDDGGDDSTSDSVESDGSKDMMDYANPLTDP